MKRAAIISVILKDPQKSQSAFNDIVSNFHEIILGRMGIPFRKGTTALISLTVAASLDTINEFISKIAHIEGVIVKATTTEQDIEID